MNRDFASSLIQLNNTFYREHAASFSDTRQAPWPGWIRTMDVALKQLDIEAIERPLRVFDLACGNMRFEHFLSGGLLMAKGARADDPQTDESFPIEFYGVDSCQDLAIDARGHALRIPNLHFQELDVLDALMKLNPACPPSTLFDAPLADVTVCFGFMHHVPSGEYRVRVLDALVRQTRPGGIIAISFWEFMNDERMAKKAVRAEARAELTPPFEGYDSAQFEVGDHLIGWQNDRHAYRYCHHFDDAQITELVHGVRTFYKSGEVPVRELERFHADGRSGDLNRYVILKRL